MLKSRKGIYFFFDKEIGYRLRIENRQINSLEIFIIFFCFFFFSHAEKR
jgi:hypothetical protein